MASKMTPDEVMMSSSGCGATTRIPAALADVHALHAMPAATASFVPKPTRRRNLGTRLRPVICCRPQGKCVSPSARGDLCDPVHVAHTSRARHLLGDSIMQTAGLLRTG